MSASLLRPEPALNLAVLRIVLPLVVLCSRELWQAEHWAALPRPLRVAPELLSRVLPLLPADPAAARRAQWLLIGACGACALGLCSRLAAGLVTLAGLRVFGLAQLDGAVVHDMHLFWFSALLAVSPCGDALSLDCLLARARRPGTLGSAPAAAARAYGAPLQGVRALLGVIYFFPGFWKLWSSGPAWIFSDNLRNQMYLKWYEHGFIPVLRIDHWPALLRTGAFGVVAFELCFGVLALTPRLRWVALCAGLAFHALAELFLRIPFMSLWVCYCVLIDWDGLASRLRGRRPAEVRQPDPLPRLASSLVAALLAVNVVQGARGAMQAWPFACYPTFQWMVPARIPDLRIEASLPDGTLRVIADGPGSGGQRSQAQWAQAWRLAGMYGDAAPSRAQLRAYWSQLCQREHVCDQARGATALRFYAAHYSVLPEQRGAAPLDKTLIGELRPQDL